MNIISYFNLNSIPSPLLAELILFLVIFYILYRLHNKIPFSNMTSCYYLTSTYSEWDYMSTNSQRTVIGLGLVE